MVILSIMDAEILFKKLVEIKNLSYKWVDFCFFEPYFSV